MDFAVIRLAGKQHVVSVGSIIEITGDPTKIEVLLLSQNDIVSVGTPVLENVKVGTEVVFTGKGEKIRVAKFKAKSRYRKVMGFRPLITKVRILSIGTPVIAKSEATKQSSSAKKSPVKKSKTKK